MIFSKIFNYIRFLSKVNVKNFLYLNYFCKNVERMDASKIIPYKNTVIDIEKNVKIVLGGGDIELGCDSFKGAKTETRLRMRNGAVWSIYGGCKISYDSTIEVLDHALLDTNYFTMNSNSVLVVAKKISLGQDVMIGRSVTIYDSDHHCILDKNGKIMNSSAPVIIGNHVWIATNALVLKGTKIGSNTVIGANAVVSKQVSSGVIFTTQYNSDFKNTMGEWTREKP